jgi:hypothetical protein
MSKDLVADDGEAKRGRATDTDRIARLEQDVERFRKALEEIRDHPFEQSNSPRLTDQLWHFVRWSKAIARRALEQSASDEPDK